MKPCGLPIERINEGKPIISPTNHTWENGKTINAAAVFLENSAQNAGILHHLLGPDRQPGAANGIVAILYRAIPAIDSGFSVPFSYIGLAIFTPELRLLRRFSEPVLAPSPGSDSFDAFGIEDPRITRIGELFYMLYCGPHLDAEGTLCTRLCLATSLDLVQWEKHGPIAGGPDLWNNKDGVLFPRQIDGRYYLLHRPWGSNIHVSDYSIWLASSPTLNGSWEEHGEVLHSYSIPGCRESWVGAGSVPIPLDETHFLVIYHTGNYLNGTNREYDVGVALFGFTHFSPDKTGQLVTARLEPLIVPETEFERSFSISSGQLDVVFPCGSYEYQDDIYIIYGASDNYVAAARVNKKALLKALENSNLENPYIQTEITSLYDNLEDKVK